MCTAHSPTVLELMASLARKFIPIYTIVMSKQCRTGEAVQTALEPERRWYWVLTPAGMWAFHSAYRSQQLTSQSELAIRRGAQDATQHGTPMTVDLDDADASVKGAHPKRKRDASP